jgi:hypothetical protein
MIFKISLNQGMSWFRDKATISVSLYTPLHYEALFK